MPVVHLDELYWQPGWQPAECGAWRRRQERLVAADSWVIDGNYLSTLDVRLRAADTVVFLDLPAWRCAWRATRRVLKGRGGANTAAGCPERLDRRHLRFLGYICGFRRHARPRVLHQLEQPGHRAMVVRMTTPSQVKRFLSRLS